MAEIKFNYGTALPSNPDVKQLYFIKNGDKGRLYKGSELIAETSFEENLALQSQITNNANSLASLVKLIDENYLTKENAEDTYLTLDAASSYLTKNEASNNYLTKNTAGQTYVTKTTIENNYLTKSDAGQIYVTDAVVKNDYLNKTDAEAIYLTKDAASNTYLTKGDAGRTYATQGSVTDSINEAKTEAISSAVDQAVNQIVGEGAADSLNTIAEISAALDGNPDIIDALNGAIGNKADQTALDNHIANESTNSLHLTSDEKNKLSGIQWGAQANQNAFKNITVGSSTIVADTQEATLTIVAGNHINISADATNDKLTFSVPNASTTATGVVLLSDAVNSTSTEFGATANAVKKAYDLANGKQNKIQGAATSITNSDLTMNRALVSDVNGKVAVSEITSTKLGYLTDVTGNIQEQLNNLSTNQTGYLPLAGGTMEQKANIKWEPKNNLTPYIGPCTSSADGTFLFGSLEGNTYSNGLAIGGGSKNLLWKGKRVITADGGGATGTWGISISGDASGNAGTATQFQSNATVELTGDVTGSASSKKGWSISTELKNSGVTAGNYGPSANASPAHGKTFLVPYITIDAKGRVTAASTKTITLPSDSNTHYTTGITAGATGTTSNSAVSNPFIKIKDDSTHRSQIQIKGSGATSVSSDANGVITISSTDNNTTYGVATSSALGLVKSGTDITVDSSGNVSVVDGSHNHSAGNITSGTLSTNRLPTVPISKGGTGATTAASALTNLGAAPIANGTYVVTAESADGATYTATVPSITSLTVGVSFIMIPNKQSTTKTPTLNVNNLGAKNIKRNTAGILYSGLTTGGYITGWLSVNEPIEVIYNGTEWIVKNNSQPSANDLYGTVPIKSGGTGATTAAGVLTNLGLTATATELNYCDGVTSNIQTQINNLTSQLNTYISDILGGAS